MAAALGRDRPLIRVALVFVFVVMVSALAFRLGATTGARQAENAPAGLAAQAASEAVPELLGHERSAGISGARLSLPPDSRAASEIAVANDVIVVRLPGGVQLFERATDGWRAAWLLRAPEVYHVATDGQTVALNDRAGITLYRRDGDGWVLDGQINDSGPRQIVLWNGILATESGTLFRRAKGSWGRLAVVRPPEPWIAREYRFTADGSLVIAAQFGRDPLAVGQLFLFSRDDMSWTLTGTAPLQPAGGLWGEALWGLGDDRLAVAEPGGTIGLYTTLRGLWVREASVKVPHYVSPRPARTSAISIAGDFLVLATATPCEAPGGACSQGVAYALVRDRTGGWGRAGTLIGMEDGEGFATRFASSGNVFVSATDRAGVSRALYVFAVSDGRIIPDPGFPTPGSVASMRGVVTADALNVRMSPDTSSRIIRELNLGEAVMVLGRNDRWLELEDGGWVFYSSEWLDLEGKLELLRIRVPEAGRG